MVNIRIDDKDYQVQDGLTILQAAVSANITIPTICYLDGISEEAACSVCVVEVKGAKTLLRACVTKVTPGMEIFTATERVRKARVLTLSCCLQATPVIVLCASAIRHVSFAELPQIWASGI